MCYEYYWHPQLLFFQTLMAKATAYRLSDYKLQMNSYDKEDNKSFKSSCPSYRYKVVFLIKVNGLKVKIASEETIIQADP